jgi:hypothetical protein
MAMSDGAAGDGGGFLGLTPKQTAELAAYGKSETGQAVHESPTTMHGPLSYSLGLEEGGQGGKVELEKGGIEKVPGGQDVEEPKIQQKKEEPPKAEESQTRKSRQQEARKRRRSLLGEEEEGVLEPANVRRRMLWGE